MRMWVETWLVRLTERIRELIPQTGWCISEWAICDFQWRDGWWARKGDNRGGAGTARGLNRDQIVKSVICFASGILSLLFNPVICNRTVLNIAEKIFCLAVGTAQVCVLLLFEWLCYKISCYMLVISNNVKFFYIKGVLQRTFFYFN